MPNLTPDGLLQYARWTRLTPDIFRIAGTDPSGAAPVITVLSWPGAGEELMLQLNFAGDDGGVDFAYTVTAADTPVTIAQIFGDMITANPTCAAAHITGEWTPGTNALGVNHEVDNVPVISAQRHPECFLISEGGAALDAGPILAFSRNPGFSPAPGSSIGQIVFGAPDAAGVEVEYIVEGACVTDNRPGSWGAKKSWYTLSNRNGVPYTVLRASIGTDGLMLGESDTPVGRWQDYACQVASYEGHLAGVSVEAKRAVVQDICFVYVKATIDKNGDGANFITASLPFPAVGGATFFGKASLTSGKMLIGYLGSPTEIVITNAGVPLADQYPGPKPGQREILELSGQYRIAG